MSKGSKAVCMRFPEPHMGNIEAEAAAKGISVPELCRRIIIERNQPVETQRATEQLTSIPTPLSRVDPIGSHRIETPAPSSVRQSQKVEEAIAAGTAAEVLANIQAKFPELSPPTEAMVLAGKGLARIEEKRPEMFDRWIEERIANGMSGLELVEFYKLLAIHGGEQGPAATRTERKIH